MNNFEPRFGIAISSQHGTPYPSDFAFVERIKSVIANNSVEEALEIILTDNRLSGSQSALKEIGLNITAIRNIITEYIKEGKNEEALDIVKSIADLLVFGIDNDVVFEKYVNLLKLFNFSILRFSLDWNKLIDGSLGVNLEAINEYAGRVALLKTNGIEPIITFSHFETLGFDIHTEDFEQLFEELSLNVLNILIPAGVKYWIAFNEPGVHSGGITLGFWGAGEMKLSKAIDLYKQHLGNLKQFGKLSKLFYDTAHKIAQVEGVEIKVVANFNISIFDPGTSPTFFDKFCVWFANKVDKDSQLKPYEFADGSHAFDILALNPYQVYNSAYTNRFLRAKLPRFFNKLTSLAAKLARGAYMYGEGGILADDITDIIESEINIPNTANPDFFDLEEMRFGNHGQILYPKGISLAIKQMHDKYGKDEIALTESGADISSSDHEGIRNKIWYIKKVKEELEKLKDDGITIPFVLIWTLVRMWEILGPTGGGIGTWDFGILAEPLSRDRITERLMVDLKMEYENAQMLAEQIVKDGNTPLRIYKGMIENLGRIFASTEISAKQVVETFITSRGGGNELIINILQLLELKDYYAQLWDSNSLEVLNLAIQEAMQRYEQKNLVTEQ